MVLVVCALCLVALGGFLMARPTEMLESRFEGYRTSSFGRWYSGRKFDTQLQHEQQDSVPQGPTLAEMISLTKLSSTPVDDESQWTRRLDAAQATVAVGREPHEAVLLTDDDWWALRFSHSGTVVTAVGFDTPPIYAFSWTPDLTAFEAHRREYETERKKFL
jgi:hypothetical protein